MRFRNLALPVALLVVAAILRFGVLDRVEIWIDEAESVRNVQGSMQDMVGDLAMDNKPPLYYVLLQAWLGVFGADVIALRSFSALCGVLAVAVVWWLGVSLVPRPVARVAALLLAFHPLAVHYSREGRNYSLFLLLAFLTIFTMAAAIESGTRGWWAAYAASLSACVMTHYIGILLLVVSALQLVLARRRSATTPWATSAAIAMLPLLAWWPWVMQQRAIAASSLAWYQAIWKEWNLFDPLLRSLVALTPGGATPPWVGLPAWPAFQPFVVLSGIAALASFLFPIRDGSLVRGTRAILLFAVAGPLVLLWLASVAAFPVYIVGRADLIALPGVVLILSMGIVAARSVPLAAVVGGLIGTSTLVGLVAAFAMTRPDVERPVVEPLAQSLQAGDLVVCTGLTRPTAEYYVRRNADDVVLASYPGDMERHAAFFDPRGWTPDLLEAEADAVDDEIGDAFRRKRRAFVLLTGHPSTLPLREKLAAKYRLETTAHYFLRREANRVSVIEVLRRRTP